MIFHNAYGFYAELVFITCFFLSIIQLYKVNVETNEKLNWKPDDNSIISEPVFVANPNTDSDDEDDGVVLSVLLPLEKPRFAVLVVLNAKDLTELGRADIEADGTVTGTLHGIWNPL